MTYAQDEASVDSGEPVELYEFVGTSNTYRFTSSEADVTFDPGGGSQTFSAIGIHRTDLEVSEDGTAPEITVKIPVDQAIVTEYVFGVAPPDLYATIYRIHPTTGTIATVWEGEVHAWSVEEHLASFRIPSDLVSRFEETLPVAKYKVNCNNVLYDFLCDVPSGHADNFESTAIQAGGISDNGLEITVGSMGIRPTGWANGGVLIHDTTGERRTIMDHTGLVLTILWPFSAAVAPTDAVTINRGCDKSLDDCVNKFANWDNFNGMPFVLSQALNPTQNGE